MRRTSTDLTFAACVDHRRCRARRVPALAAFGLALLRVPFALAEDPTPEPEVQVKGRLQSGSSVDTTTVTSGDLAHVPTRTAEDALRLVPGMTLVQHGSEGKGVQYLTRGFDAVHGSDFEVTLEGIPLNEWSNVHGQGYLDLGFVPAELVRSATVHHGALALDQGAFGTAGSAHYRLGIAPDARGLRAAITLGTTMRKRLLLSYSPEAGDGREFIATELLHDDAFGQNREITRSATIGRITLKETETSRWSLLGAIYGATFDLPGAVRQDDVQAGRVGFYDTYDDAQRGTSARALVGFGYEERRGDHDIRAVLWSGVRTLSLLDDYTGFLVDPNNGDRRLQQQESLDVGFDVGDSVRLSKRLTLEVGGSTRAAPMGQTQDQLGRQLESARRALELSAIQMLFGARGGLTWNPLDALRVDAGLRLDLATIQARDQLAHTGGSGAYLGVSPRVSARLRATPGLTFTAGYGRGFRPPEARSVTGSFSGRTSFDDDVIDDDAPTMTQTDSFELGGTLRLFPGWYLSSTGFATLVERETIFDHVSGTSIELSSTRRFGGEFSLTAHPLDWLVLAADTTLTEARFVDTGRPIPFAPWLTGGVRANVEYDGWQAGLRFLGIAPRDLQFGAKGSTYALLDATGGYHFPRVHVDLAIENLLGLELRDAESNYASDWSEVGGGSGRLPTIHLVAAPPRNARLSLTLLY